MLLRLGCQTAGVRLRVSALRSHRCRYSKVPVNLDCPFVKEHENQKYNSSYLARSTQPSKKSFIPAKNYIHPNAFKLSLLLADGKNWTSLALFLSKAFYVRNQSLQA